MGMSFDQSGMDGMHSALRRFDRVISDPSPVLQGLGTELAEMWKANILDGPNERWEAGESKRALKESGTTLYDTGMMLQSITGQQVADNEIAVGSRLTVADGFNLLAIHEFGATIHRVVKPGAVKLRTNARGELERRGNLAIFAGPLHKRFRTVAYEGGNEYEIRIPRRPTSPFDWDNGTLLPAADALVTGRLGDYLVEAAQP